MQAKGKVDQQGELRTELWTRLYFCRITEWTRISRYIWFHFYVKLMFTSNVSGQLQLAPALDWKQSAYTPRKGFLGVMREPG